MSNLPVKVRNNFMAYIFESGLKAVGGRMVSPDFTHPYCECAHMEPLDLGMIRDDVQEIPEPTLDHHMRRHTTALENCLVNGELFQVGKCPEGCIFWRYVPREFWHEAGK